MEKISVEFRGSEAIRTDSLHSHLVFEVVKAGVASIVMTALKDGRMAPSCLCCIGPRHTATIEQAALDLGCEYILWEGSKWWGNYPWTISNRWDEAIAHRFVDEILPHPYPQGWTTELLLDLYQEASKRSIPSQE